MVSIGKNVLMLSVMICLVLFGIAFLLTGHPEGAFIAIGALAGWIGGNYNGKREETGTSDY